MTHRFFIPTNCFEDDKITLRGPLVHATLAQQRPPKVNVRQ